MESFLFMILPIDNLSRISKTGQPKLINMEIKTLLNFLLVTNLISNQTDKSKQNKEKLQLNPWELNSQKHQPRTPLTFKKLLQLYQTKLNQRFKEDQPKVLKIKKVQVQHSEKLKIQRRNQAAVDNKKLYINNTILFILKFKATLLYQ